MHGQHGEHGVSPDQGRLYCFLKQGKDHVDHATMQSRAIAALAGVPVRQMELKAPPPHFGHGGSHFGARGTGEMFYVPTSAAFPSKRPFCSRLFDLFENRIGLIPDRL
jgi:hypothetical protein